MTVSKSDPIAIIGGGCFGLSTALELTKCGYTNIIVFEKDAQIPSRWSAANDLNKIVRAEYEDDFYTDLAVEAIKQWQTPLFAPYFHRTGFLNCVSKAGPQKAVQTMKRFQDAAERHPDMRKFVSNINTRQDILDIAWQLQGPLPGWKGYFNAFDGYAHSADALRGIYRALRSNGVRFFLGPDAGDIHEIEYEQSQNGRRARAVRTKAGRRHAANLIIVTVGAAATRLVPQIGSQVVAKSWSVAHIHLTDEETASLRGIPVTYARDLGFLFEPDPRTNLLKICPMGGGYVNTNPSTGISLPPSPEASAILPKEDEARIRGLLSHTFPHLAQRPLVRTSLCWFADTADSDFIIDYVPDTSSSVILFSGDSGHGFKMFPIAGWWIRDLLKAPSGKQEEASWRWRNPDAEDQFKDVSWRLGHVEEFATIKSESIRSKL